MDYRLSPKSSAPRVEGRQEGRKELVVRLLTPRSGRRPEEPLPRLEPPTSVQALDALGERLLTARSLEELGLA